MANTQISPAPAVEAIADDLIRAVHQDVMEARMLYLFTTDEAPCRPRKCNPLLRYGYSLHVSGAPRADVDEGPDFLVLVNVAEWNLFLPVQQEAKIDHLLSHIAQVQTNDGGIKWILLNHQVEEFPDVIRRHGLYTYGIAEMANVISQLSLDLNA